MAAKLTRLLAVLLVISACASVESSREKPATAFDLAGVRIALQAAEPYVVSILGDSTSQVSNSWVFLVAEELSVRYERTVSVHTWDADLNRYAGLVTYGDGEREVTIWNGSARGQSAQYSARWYEKLVPEPVDLTLVNHGHNNPWHAIAGIDLLVKAALGNSKTAGGVVVILQNPRLGDEPRAKLEQRAIDELRAAYTGSNDAVIADVNSKFQGADLPTLLNADGIHPNEEGHRLWAETVLATLGLA